MRSVNLLRSASCMVRRLLFVSSVITHLFFFFFPFFFIGYNGVVFIGDSLNSCLVAVVCVEPDVLKDWAASEGIKVNKTLPIACLSDFLFPTLWDYSLLFLTFLWNYFFRIASH